ncbi:ester cyclase [Bradyrhizobium sp.]|uniref:nuclear transport factor 2 family protein n=1 Tax=Bradyrhizobium sp. TaxID=376 RepID=UPI0027221DFF|nr:ester cyclase [Bradyrhizobium sp.]MDO9298840.1 ester cyclase [Bradyrhizobium sp.]
MRVLVVVLLSMLTLAVSPAAADDAAKLAANEKTVLEFYEAGLNRKDFDAAAKFFGSRYVQHNPTAPDGIEGFKAFLNFLREKFPDSRSEIKRSFAEGDYVILHVHSVREKGTRGRAIVDIFKLEDGKIVEHWDVVQDVPEKAANSNGMF